MQLYTVRISDMFCCDNERKQAIGVDVDVKVKLRWEILMSSLVYRTIIFDFV